MKVLVVEDDELIAESLTDILDVLGHESIGTAADAETAIALCNQVHPDIALLDIQIGGDLDGIELAEILHDDFDIPFVFTTAFADGSTLSRAKERGPFGYVIKPYGTNDINAALEVAINAFKRLKEAEVHVSPQIIDHSIMLKVDTKLIKVRVDDILYIEAKGDYGVFKTKDSSYIVHTTMKRVQDRLTKYNFQKVHRSYVVNLSKITDIEDSNMVIEDKLIPISRANKDMLMKRLNLF